MPLKSVSNSAFAMQGVAGEGNGAMGGVSAAAYVLVVYVGKTGTYLRPFSRVDGYFDSE